MIKKYILSTLLLLTVITIKAQNIALFNQFLGKYDFTMIGNTMNPSENSENQTFCNILTTSSATLNLGPGQTIEAAYLYWAGSGSLTQADLNIKLNGTTVTPDRTFTTLLAVNPTFGAFADVTSLVSATGNGNYTVSDFDLNGVIGAYCGNRTNFGGWSILIVYHDPTLTNNLVKVYDGFERVDSGNQDLIITLNNLDIFNVAGNRMAFLSWEGDKELNFSETLRVNNFVVSNPPLNPADRVFNSTNSFTNSSNLHNMDMDWFDIDAYTDINDVDLEIRLHSGIGSSADAIIFNNIVLVLNSEVPDATIEIETAQGGCDDRDISVDFTVHNTVATKELPADTPIAFFAGTTLVGMSATQNIIPIGGSESGSIVLTIPNTVPNNFTLTAHVDNNGSGVSIVREFIEDNNTDEEEILLGTTPSVFPANNITICDSNDDGQEIFNLTIPGNQILGTQTGVTIRYYENQTDADNGTANDITTPAGYTNTSSSQTIYIRLEDPAGCFVVTSFDIEVTPPALLSHTIPDLVDCVDEPDSTGIITDLTSQESFILNGNNPADYSISYHTSEGNAREGINAIATPNSYPNTSNPQTIWVRLVDNLNCVQYGSFDIVYNFNPSLQTTTLESCSLDGPGTFNLTDANELVIGNTAGIVFTYHEDPVDADGGVNPLPDDYTPATETAIVYVRAVNEFGCYSVIQITLETVINNAEINNVYAVCDDPWQINDATAVFDLTSYQGQIENALVIPGAIITYYTTQENAESDINPINNPNEFENTSNPQFIYARAANPNGGCGGVAEFQIEVLPVPEFELPAYIAFCEDDEPVYEFGESFSTYVWSDADGNIIGNSATVEFENEGIYMLEVTNSSNSCPAIRDVEVILDHSPLITHIEVDGNTVSVFPTGGEAPYEYSYNEGLTWHDYFVLTDVPSGVHSMLVRSKYGCVSEAKLFGVLGIPNVITPNGDGYNDYWEIRALDMYPEAYIKIFDRYGKIFVDRKMGTDFRWDGKYLGNPLPSSDYWYIITIEEGKSISGHISIKRQ